MPKSPRSLRPIARPNRHSAISAVTGKPMVLSLDITKEKTFTGICIILSLWKERYMV